MGRLEGKVAFITGVARGQGRSHAIRLAEEGADIIGVDSLADFGTTAYPMPTQDDLDETTVLVEKTGRRAILSRADVRDREGLQRAAGNGGSIILTASAAGLRFGLNLGDYAATKAGVIALAKTLANEVAAERIRVNAICPGAVATPMITANEELFKLFRPDVENPTLQDCEPAFKTLMPMGGPWLAPEDVSNMVVFLASDEASSVTGTAMSVDQGTVNR
jgi:(+)-trans-carveol dehydrogenase